MTELEQKLNALAKKYGCELTRIPSNRNQYAHLTGECIGYLFGSGTSRMERYEGAEYATVECWIPVDSALRKDDQAIVAELDAMLSDNPVTP